MKTIFSNSMVAHVWAQQSQQSGRSGNGNFYFEGRTLYSYGSHFPVGIFAGVGGPVFLNADGYSVSTSRHKSSAWHATRHLQQFYMPELCALADMMRADSYATVAVTAYLARNWQEIPADSDGAAWLLAQCGTGKRWPTMRQRLAAQAERAAIASKARDKAAAVKEGRELAALDWRNVRLDAWRNAAGTNNRALSDSIKSHRAARLATPKAHKRIRAALLTYETRLRSILSIAQANSNRWGNPNARLKARATLATLQRFKAGAIGYVPGYEGPNGPAKRQAALDMPNGAGWRLLATSIAELLAAPIHMPPAMRAAATELCAQADSIATEREGEQAQRDAIATARATMSRELKEFNFRKHEARAAGNPRQIARALDGLFAHVPDAIPWNARRGFELRPDMAARAERIATAAQALADSLRPVYDAAMLEANRLEDEQRAAERAERERIANMSDSERRDEWEAGRLSAGNLPSYGGPLLRAIAPEIEGCTVKGGTLETSQGATVPLRHAFRVFQFVAACRAAGKAWTPGKFGPSAIRVGHFTVDSIDQSGDFRAGCHSIEWPEIERLATRLGLITCLAPLETVTAELESV